MVFGVVGLRFNCFRILLMGSYIRCIVELENAKASFSMGFCERTTCTEDNSPCRATEAGLFSNLVYVYGHQIFRRSLRSKTVFFEVHLGRKFLEKKFDLNLRRNFRLEFAKELSTWICEGMIFSESWSCFVFGNVQLTPTCFQMWLVDSLKHLHQFFKRIPRSNSNFFTVNLPTERSFEQVVFFSALT